MSLKTDSPVQLFLFSGIASCIAELCTVPIDVVKVRLQLGAGIYKSSFDAFTRTVKDEGVLALWKGVQPALLRQATYGSARIGMYEPIKEWYQSLLSGGRDTKPGDVSILVKLLSGVTSGALASGIFNPTDVIKVRMQADGMAKAPGASSAGAAGASAVERAAPRYSNVFQALYSIGQQEGVRGLYAGVSPTMQRAAVVASVELATYDEAKQLLVRRFGFAPDSIVTHFGASGLAGFLATVASSPTDVLKSHLMSQPVDEHGRGLKYRNTVHCLRSIVAEGGVGVLWRGFWPNFGRIMPHSIILFLVIEQLRNAFSPGKTQGGAGSGSDGGGQGKDKVNSADDTGSKSGRL